MTNPYRIEGPALISFSGGRTSAYMLRQILDAHDGRLPPDVHVCFANTGKEREETLRFVHECGSRWGVDIRWLEFVTDLKRPGPAARFCEVGYNSASRNGEPLDRLILRKQAIFSTISGRWCTEFAKVGTLHAFMQSLGYSEGEYVEVIGFRADERDRVEEMPAKPRNVARRFSFPLAKAEVRKSDVNAWWAKQPFDLQIPSGGGNCDHCPFLKYETRVARARLDPAGIRRWWLPHEQAKEFSFGRESFEEILAAATNSPPLPLGEIEADAADSECAGWCDERDAA